MPNRQRKPPATSAHVTGRVRLAIAALAVALAALAVTPVVVSVRTRALRSEITEVAEPTIATLAEIERTVALQLAALRGYALLGDTSFLTEYRHLDTAERRAEGRLRTLAMQLDVEVQHQASLLVEREQEWDVGARAALASGARQDSVTALLRDQGLPEAVLEEAASLRRSIQLLERLRRSDIAGAERAEIWVNRMMILLAALAAIALAILGRQLRDLVEAAETNHAELQHELARRARLIRGISHDLKNPLGAADAHAELLEAGIKGPLGEEQRSSLRAIRRSVRSTVRLIDDLLHLARAERGEVPVEPKDVDFSRLVEEIAEETRTEAEAHGLRFELLLPAEPVRGRTDPRRAREVVGNLLTNAIRYTPSGGLVRLKLQPLETSGGRHRGGARISVSDTGPGIAMDDRDRIFDEFERIGRDGPGSGLGLAISREMARLLGGEIELESEIGRGSTFSLILPPAVPAD